MKMNREFYYDEDYDKVANLIVKGCLINSDGHFWPVDDLFFTFKDDKNIGLRDIVLSGEVVNVYKPVTELVRICHKENGKWIID